ncbi:hypothetical protein [Pontibacter pamirensis]|uniref:hypothetical protein n=1 Tax=Pontibacter pamirensis TaxID=2562824 RepID=UPI00138A2324|nr:hypothetical protein [Pontibacter pamirensis]
MGNDTGKEFPDTDLIGAQFKRHQAKDPFASVDVVPSPGEGASDPKYNRLAAEESRLTDFGISFQQRSTGFALTQMGERLASQAKDLNELALRVRQQFSSHLLQNDQDAERLADAAFRAFAKRNPNIDPDLTWMMIRTIGKEYLEIVKAGTRRQIAARARAMEQDPVYRANQEWREKIQRYVDETGLDYQFVEAFVMEYEKGNMPRHPGVIDPRSIPFFQSRAGLQSVAMAINMMTHGTAGSFASAVTGLDMSGNELSTGERILEGVFVVISLMPGGGLAGDAAMVAKLGLTAAKTIVFAGRSLARVAMSARTSVTAFLRILSRLRHIDPRKVAELLKRMREARAAGKRLRLTDGEARLMREIDQAFVEYTLPIAKVVKIATPTARAFMFLNRRQPLVLGRLLGRTWGKPASKMAKSTLQDAEDIAASITDRIRRHWNAALPKGQDNALEACQGVYRKLEQALRSKSPPNPNNFVRDKLYKKWRARAMRRIGNDNQLVNDLKEHAGIIVGKNRLTRSWTIHIRTKGPKAQRVQTHVDFDHGIVGHSKAVDDAVRLKDARPLISTIDGGNLQFMTARENRNFIEALRQAAAETSGP